MRNDHRRRALVTVFLCCACGVWLGACNPAQQARQSLAEGDPVRAVQFYEQAARRQPGDRQLAGELARAQADAASLLGARAERALAAGREDEAIRLARAAASHDPARRTLETHIRHTIARRYVESAEAALSAGAFEKARGEAMHARSIAHDLPDAAQVLARIDERQARMLAQGAVDFAEAGEFERAATIARHAAELLPSDEATASLPATIDRMRREVLFDELYVRAQADLDARRLTALSNKLGELSGFDVRREALAELTAAYEDCRSRLVAALTAADEARDRGDFTEASRLYAAAAGLVSDRPDIEAARAACEVDRRVAALLRDGELNMRQSLFAEAAESFRRALLVRADASTEARYRQAGASHHRQALYEALDRRDRAAAIRHLTALQRVEPDEAAELILYRLKVELVDASLAEAATLHAEGQTEAALTVLAEAMKDAHDQQLIDLYAVLSAERLAQEAVEADAAGDVDLARSLYLKALSRDPDRRGLAERMRDLGLAREIRENYEDARRLAADLDAALRERKQMLDDVWRQLAARQRELAEAQTTIDRLEEEAAGGVAAITLLNQRVEALQQEVAALTRDATFWRDEATRWRKKYEEKKGGG